MIHSRHKTYLLGGIFLTSIYVAQSELSKNMVNVIDYGWNSMQISVEMPQSSTKLIEMAFYYKIDFINASKN